MCLLSYIITTIKGKTQSDSWIEWIEWKDAAFVDGCIGGECHLILT